MIRKFRKVKKYKSISPTLSITSKKSIEDLTNITQEV